MEFGDRPLSAKSGRSDSLGKPHFIERFMPAGVVAISPGGTKRYGCPMRAQLSLTAHFTRVWKKLIFILPVHGRIEYTEQEYRDLFQQSGFKFTTVTPD